MAPKPMAPKPAPKPVQPALVPPRDACRKRLAADVNMGHIMALQTHAGFKAEAFAEAKRALADRRYASIEDAARAVADKAVELSNNTGGDPFEPLSGSHSSYAQRS